MEQINQNLEKCKTRDQEKTGIKFAEQAEEALRYWASQVAKNEADLEKAKRNLEDGEKSVKKTREELEKLRQGAKAAGLWRYLDEKNQCQK